MSGLTPLKSTLYSLLALVALAFLGSFLGLWKLPYQHDPYTYRDLSRKLGRVISFDDELRDARDDKIEENEALFREEK